MSFPEPISETPIGDWLVQCFQTQRAANDCQAFQRVTMNNGTAVALVTTFAYTTPTQLEIQMAFPLGVDLSAGARFAMGAEFTTTIPISRCTQQGCLVEGTVGENLGRMFRDSTQATVTVTVPGRGDFQVPFSLDGLTEALSAIRPDPPAAPPTSAQDDQITPPSAEPEPDTSLAPVTGDEN
ncbi:invasion associated locus B family protein [Cognatishimia sp. MH4019]|uniref:invasion associated locus B family protein n=1 Tax=Cognatishimia sp. MH4019 TaxID=2854030 RepID=UPI001CD46455|nr:invasion associated locus B family protein [Cognatishimia sp. MH4019]